MSVVCLKPSLVSVLSGGWSQVQASVVMVVFGIVLCPSYGCRCVTQACNGSVLSVVFEEHMCDLEVLLA